MIKAHPIEIGWQGEQESQQWVINAMTAVQTWRQRGGWYNIVAAAKPVTNWDNGQQPGPRCGTSGGVGAQDESDRRSMWKPGMRSGPGATLHPDDAWKQRDCRYEAPPHSPSSSSAICLCRPPLPV